MPSNKKKVQMEGHSLSLILPSHPSKVGTKIEGTLFGFQTPSPPLKLGKFIELS